MIVNSNELDKLIYIPPNQLESRRRRLFRCTRDQPENTTAPALIEA